MIRWLWLAVLLALPHAASAGELRMLSYNIRGIPPVITFLGRPGTRIPLIVEKLDAYDLALLQETFSYQDVVERCVADAGCEIHRGPGRTFRVGHVIAAPVLGLCWLTPRCRLPTNSGLMTVAQPARVTTERIAAEHFSRCWGYLIGGNDCFAAKGFVAVRTTLADGAQVDVYNTHFDAANWRWDRTTRRSQFEELREALARHSAGRALIVAGDLNVRDRVDRESFERFREATGLRDIGECRSGGEGDERGLDHILFRPGDATELTCEHAGKADGFTYERGGEVHRLSDHDPLVATFRVERAAAPPNR